MFMEKVRDKAQEPDGKFTKQIGTTVYTVNGQYVIDTPLVELEKKLDPRHFTRVHRSHIVAIDYIAECRKGDAGRMVMVLRDKAATQLVVSRSLVKKIKAL